MQAQPKQSSAALPTNGRHRSAQWLKFTILPPWVDTGPRRVLSLVRGHGQLSEYHSRNPYPDSRNAPIAQCRRAAGRTMRNSSGNRLVAPCYKRGTHPTGQAHQAPAPRLRITRAVLCRAMATPRRPALRARRRRPAQSRQRKRRA